MRASSLAVATLPQLSDGFLLPQQARQQFVPLHVAQAIAEAILAQAIMQPERTHPLLLELKQPMEKRGELVPLAKEDTMDGDAGTCGKSILDKPG